MTDELGPLVGMADKLAMHASISSDDRAHLVQLPHVTRALSAGSHVTNEGKAVDCVSVLVHGLAYGYKTSGSGQRQIVSIAIPGEMLDLPQLYLPTADHNVQTLTHCVIAVIPHLALRDLARDRPVVGDALLAASLLELARAREWLLNVGRRDARARVAHLICELAVRLDGPTLPPGQPFKLPMTQEHLGDAVGLTSVHVNRTLRRLADEGLLFHAKGNVLIPDWDKLVSVAEFDDRYLHFGMTV